MGVRNKKRDISFSLFLLSPKGLVNYFNISVCFLTRFKFYLIMASHLSSPALSSLDTSVISAFRLNIVAVHVYLK